MVAEHTAVVVMGVSGCGKSTVGKMLAERLDWPFAEADDFHPPANKAKMEAGKPLTDDDRMPWLRDIRDWITSQDTDVVVTCSALRRRYRDVLREADAQVVFLHLHGSRQLLVERTTQRKDHFMPPALLDSQLNTLEPLESDEAGSVVSIDAETEDIVAGGMKQLSLPTR